MTQKFYFENSLAVKAVTNNLNTALPIIQGAVDAFNRTADSPLKDIAELQSMLTPSRKADAARIEQALFDRMAAGNKAVQEQRELFPDSVLMERLKAWPPDLTGIVEAFEALSRPFFGPGYAEAFYWECFVLAGSKVTLNPDAVEATLDKYRYTATTPDQKKREAATRKLVEAVTVFHKEFPEIFPESLQINNLVLWDFTAGNFTGNPEFIQFGRKPAPMTASILTSKI